MSRIHLVGLQLGRNYGQKCNGRAAVAEQPRALSRPTPQNRRLLLEPYRATAEKMQKKIAAPLWRVVSWAIESGRILTL